MVNLVGKRVGIFQIESRINEGGGAHVYKARIEDSVRSNRRGKLAAVKVIKVEKDDREAESWLINEVDFLRELNHPSIVRLYPVSDRPLPPQRNPYLFRVDRSIDPQTPWYLAMEYLSGGTIVPIIERQRNQYSTVWKLEMLYQITSALSYVHIQEKTHRDIKPENIVLRYPPNASEAPQPVLIDFGLTEKNNNKTSGAITPAYTAPEKIQVINAMRADRNYQPPALDQDLCDIWSLGVIAYELFNGRHPYGDETKRSSFTVAFANILNKQPLPMLSDVPKDVQTLIQRMLVTDVSQRFYTDDVLRYLETQLEQFAPPFI